MPFTPSLYPTIDMLQREYFLNLETTAIWIITSGSYQAMARSEDLDTFFMEVQSSVETAINQYFNPSLTPISISTRYNPLVDQNATV